MESVETGEFGDEEEGSADDWAMFQAAVDSLADVNGVVTVPTDGV